MAEKRVPLGPTGETVRANIERLRDKQNLGYTDLARKLEQVGRPIPVLGLRRIEAAERRVDVDDLMALAAALDVSPVTLLMPDMERRADMETTPVEATGQPDGVTADQLWLWLTARRPPRMPADTSGIDRDLIMWEATARPTAYLDWRLATRKSGNHGDD
jgi:transcriptional regulator with XRE-family HTH domain